MRFNLIVLAVVLFLFNHLIIRAEDTLKVEKVKFGHEIEKIKPHSKADFETLKNGFRYILLPNKTPEKRVMVYLYVGTGSLNETDKQQGIAHFLEHMAFNGTKSYPGETLIDFFKKMGMSFGGDTNAHTSFDETVYKLNLPEEKYSNDAVSIIADYAMNMLLSSEEIEKERGIILSEKRARDSIDNRISLQDIKFGLPGNLVASRFPIGLEETINSVKREDFLDYYNTWYRPENMVLIVVGDIEPKPWKKLIEKAFKGFKAKAPLRPTYVLTDVGHKGLKINYYYEKEASDTNVEINTCVVKKPIVQSYKEKLRVELAESAAMHILNERLREKLTQKDIPFNSATMQVSNWLNNINQGSVSISCKPENWKASLIFAENELRKSLEFGFSDQELQLFKKEYISKLDKAISSMATTNSNIYMSQILGSLSDNSPFLDAVQMHDLAKPLIDEMTKEDALREFKKYWLVDHRLITVSGNVEIKDAEKEIKNALNEASIIEVTKQKEETLIAFPFEKKPEQPGKIANQEEFKELGFTKITFANNVVLNLKKTDFKKNEINFNIGFGHGALSLPPGKECMAHLASMALSEGGLTKLSKTELMKALTGKNVSCQFSVGPNCFLMQANTTPDDFELNLQLCRAKLLYSGFREDATEIINKFIDQRYNSLAANIQDYFRNSLYKIITKNNNSMALPERKVLESITLNDLKEWLTTQFKNAPIEINIVGDIDEKKTIDLVASYFGSLSEREKITAPKRINLITKDKFDITEEFKTAIKKALVFMIIPTTDYRDIEEVRKINLLGQILNEKARKLIREKLSISYSPSIGHNFNKDYKDSCYLQFIADVEPQNVEAVRNAFDSIIKDTLETGISNDDLEGVRKPVLAQINTIMKSNGFWLDRVLSDSTAEPENLKVAETFLKGYEVITFQQVTEVAKKYLSSEKKSAFVLKAKDEAINVKLEPAKTEDK